MKQLEKTPKISNQEKIQILEHLLQETLWMARRYADGRSTYAPKMFNDVVHTLDALGLQHLLVGDDGKRFADDGGLGIYQPETRKFVRD